MELIFRLSRAQGIRKPTLRAAWTVELALLPRPSSTLCMNSQLKAPWLELNVSPFQPISFLFRSCHLGVICLEEFTEGSVVARLSCLCSFHNGENYLCPSQENATHVDPQHACRLGCSVAAPALFIHADEWLNVGTIPISLSSRALPLITTRT